MRDPFALDGHTVVITGASSGLGARFARVLHSCGANVVVGARRVELLEALASELGDRIVPVACDVTSESDCRRLISAAIDTGGGRLDVLINNAGTGTPHQAEDEPLDHWRHVLDVNLTGVFMLSQLAGRAMLEQGSGVIVNIASIFGLVGSTPIKHASYCATKGAVVNLTRELACQWASGGVRVNAIAPGWFPSEMTAESMFESDASMDYLRRNCPMRRGGAEDELDGVLLFLASAASTYVTGVTIPVDGGWTAR